MPEPLMKLPEALERYDCPDEDALWKLVRARKLCAYDVEGRIRFGPDVAPPRRRKITPERREYLRTYQREWYAARRAQWFADKACVDCGSTDRLEIDHRDPAEKISHRVWTWSEERREAELAKCDVRCHGCHKRRHEARAQHGGERRYRQGCRCPVCVEGQVKLNAGRRVTRVARSPLGVAAREVLEVYRNTDGPDLERVLMPSMDRLSVLLFGGSHRSETS